MDALFAAVRGATRRHAGAAGSWTAIAVTAALIFGGLTAEPLGAAQPGARRHFAAAARTRPASVSSAPCSFYASGSCQSTSPQVTLYINTTFLAGFCTVNFNIDWADGTTKNFVVTAVFGEFAVNLGSHTYVSTGGYSIQVTASVQSGSCTFPAYTASYTYVPTGSGALVGPNLQGGGSRDILPTSCSCGDPVNTDTGEFWHTFTDLSVPGRGIALDLTHTYSSASASTLGPLGYGWGDAYGMSLSFDGSGNATVHEGNESSVTALESGSTYTFPTDVLATLVKNGDGTFTYTRRDKSVYAFSAGGRLTQEADRNGYVTSLAYNGAGRLTSVTDPSGRALTFAFSPAGLVSSVTDPDGRRVRFAYDASHNLVRSTDVGGKSWAFTYDSNHLLLTMTDPRGGVTTNTYDSSGRVLTQADPLGRTTTYSYSGAAGSGSGTTTMTDPRGEVTHLQYANNELTSTTSGFGTSSQATWTYGYDPTVLGKTSITDPRGHTTTSTYDASGNLLRTSDPLGRVTTATYNSFNEPLSVTDPKGVKTTYVYNASGNLLSEATGVQTTTFAYADAAHPGDVTSATDPNGKTTSFTYDGNGNVISVTDPLGNETTATYDGIGRMLTATTPKGGVTTNTYDAFGDVLTKTDPLGNTTTNKYDADQNLVSTKDPLGHTTTYVLDADNELTTTTRPGNISTSSSYDADGNVASSTDGAGHVTTNTYDPLNRLASSTDPLGHLTSNSYDPAGNRTAQTNPSGTTTSSVYDSDNELTSQTYSDGVTHQVTYAYDSDGRRTSMSDGTGTTTYTYDTLGRLTASTRGAAQSTGYAYDGDNQLTSLTYPDGHSVTQTYDAGGNLASVADWLGNTTTFAYDADGNLITQNVPSTTAVTDTTAYDAADQVTSITDVAGATKLQGFTYTRNADALVASVTPSGQAAQPYSYDALDRLTKDAQGRYAYATDGSLTTLLRTNPMSSNAAGQLTSSVTAGHTTSYSYDAQGDRVTTSPSPGRPTTYTFDQVGDMTGLAHGTGTASYTYNGDGLRMSKTVNGATTGYSWDLHRGVPLLLSDGSADYVYGPGGLPLEQITASGALFYHHDQLGSTTMLTDQTGASVATYTYGSYGHLLSSTGATSNPLLFAGQYRDAESGFYYLRARYYDPDTGQFTTLDPLDALTRSPYGYAAGNPVNLIDPVGLAWTWPKIIGTAATVVGVGAAVVGLCYAFCLPVAVLLIETVGVAAGETVWGWAMAASAARSGALVAGGLADAVGLGADITAWHAACTSSRTECVTAARDLERSLLTLGVGTYLKEGWNDLLTLGDAIEKGVEALREKAAADATCP